MNLSEIVKSVERLGATVIFCPLQKAKGRHLSASDNLFILIRESLSDTEKINVLLHEKAHLINQDTDNILSQSETFSHHIEQAAEANRIIDFMNLVNLEYPIDESFNYLDYMKNAFIPDKFEDLVKEEARKLFNINTNERKKIND